MSISKEIVVNVITNRIQSGVDQNLNAINNALANRNINSDDAVDLAFRVANILKQTGKSDDNIAVNIVSAFKAAAYQLLLKAGTAFNEDRQLHDNLIAFFQSVRQLIAQSNNTQSGPSLSGSSMGGMSLSVAPTSTPSTSPIAGFTGGLQASGGGIPVPRPAAPSLGGVAQPLEAFTNPAPAAAPTVNVEAQKSAARLAEEEKVANEPITKYTEVDMESYAEHELKTPKERVTVSAKEANEAVTEFLSTGNWESGLDGIIAGTSRTAYYKGADIIVRRSNNERTYLLNVNGAKSVLNDIQLFTTNHDSVLSDLKGLFGNNDPDEIIKVVTGAVNAMKKNVVTLYNNLLNSDDNTTVSAGEVTRFTNQFLGMMSAAVHNALSLGTNRCKDIPTGPVVVLERNVEDLDFFSGYLYEKTIGENGYTSEPDFFRDLFMLVANALGKIVVKYVDGEMSLQLVNVEIIIPGNYPTLKRNNVIGKHSLGATHDPVSTIYELLGSQLPEANVYLKADMDYILLSTGEISAPIYY